jgi:uncharacterized protein YihD (DUF1040 family)
MRWAVTLGELDLKFEGETQTEIVSQVQKLADKRGYQVAIDRYTDQIDVFRLTGGRWRRWLTLMPF